MELGGTDMLEFLIFMLLNCMMPFVLIGFSRYLRKQAPNPVSRIFKRKITMSAENKYVWVDVHLWRADLWRKIGWVMLVSSIGVMFVIGAIVVITGENDLTIFLGGCVLMCAQYIVIVAALLIIENERARKLRL